MAGHEWKDWFEREEFIGQISDIRVQNLQVEREVVQKRTFTRWINLHLEKCDPKMEVQDLFRDIQDGRVLMALLEELSGCKLLHGFKRSAHRIFRLNNIAKVLSFLEERNVKLVSIDATDVADGNPSIILGLIWNIILFFQIKELTGNLKSQFPSSSSLSSIPTDMDASPSGSGLSGERRQASVAMRDQGRTIKKLLQWVQNRTRKFGVAVQDFSKSWTSGLAFLAVIKSIDPSLVDMRRALLRSAKENLEEAFRTAHFSLGIPRLLEPEDVTLSPPDEQSIMTYVSQFLEHFPGIDEPVKSHEVIERSISMGRLDTELDQVRNGLHRLKERPWVVRKDWVQLPPKIFISSISEDRGLRSPTSTLAMARSWASEDSPIASTPPGVDTGVMGGVFFVSTSNSPRPHYVGSESAIGDSAIGSPDSWVGSEEAGAAPERFGESRSDGSLCDSGMAWDAGVPCATPEDATLERDLTSTSLGKPQDEQLFVDEGIYSLSSLESTQERIQVQSEKEKEEEEEGNWNSLCLNQEGASEHVPDHKQGEDKAQKDSEQMDASPLQRDQVSTEQRPSLGLYETPLQPDSGDAHFPEPKGTNQSQSSSHPMDRIEEGTDRESECAEKTTELCEDSQLQEQQMNVESVGARNGAEEFEVETVRPRKVYLSKKEIEEAGMLKGEVLERSEIQNEISQGVRNDHADPQDNTATQFPEDHANIHSEHSVAIDWLPNNQDGSLKSSLDSSTDLSGPQRFVPCDLPERGEEITCGPETVGQAGDEDPGLTGSSGSQEGPIDVNIPENAHQVHSKHMKEKENGHLGGINECDTDSPGPEAVDSHTLDRTDQPNGQFRDKPNADAPVDETADPSWADGEKERTGFKSMSEPAADMNFFYTDIDRSSPLEDLAGEALEPMDLFYPDKEESMFGEPPEALEVENDSSVFRVSALQPAPPSQPEICCVFQETNIYMLTEMHLPQDLGQDFGSTVHPSTQEQEEEMMMMKENHHPPGAPSEAQEWCLLSGGEEEERAGTRDVRETEPGESWCPTEHGDLRGIHGESLSARENMEAVRTEAGGATDESLVSTVRHRNAAGSPESKDNQTKVSSSKTHCNNSDLGRKEREELYVLLLLWLLLYCLLVLPQMDFSLSLLFNLDH